MKAAIELAVKLAHTPRSAWDSPHARGLATTVDATNEEEDAT
jgi:hypothetical protein